MRLLRENCPAKSGLLWIFMASTLLFFACEEKDMAFSDDTNSDINFDEKTELTQLEFAYAKPVKVPEFAYSFFGENIAFAVGDAEKGTAVKTELDISALTEEFPDLINYKVIEFDPEGSSQCHRYIPFVSTDEGRLGIQAKAGYQYLVYADLGAHVNNSYNIFCQLRRIDPVIFDRVPEICKYILCEEEPFRSREEMYERIPELEQYGDELQAGFPLGGLGGDGLPPRQPCEDCFQDRESAFIPTWECSSGSSSGCKDNTGGDCMLSILSPATGYYEVDWNVAGKGFKSDGLDLVIDFDDPVDISTVNVGQSLLIEGQGFDRSQLNVNLVWSQNNTRLTIEDCCLHWKRPCNSTGGADCFFGSYIIRLKGDLILDENGCMLDGDQDNRPGGDFTAKKRAGVIG